MIYIKLHNVNINFTTFISLLQLATEMNESIVFYEIVDLLIEYKSDDSVNQLIIVYVFHHCPLSQHYFCRLLS